MVNSIPNIESNNINTFGIKDFKKSPNVYWLPAPEITKDEFEKTELKQIFIAPEEARKTNNIKTIGLSIAGVTVLTAAGIFFVLQGGPKNLSKGFKKLSNYYKQQFLDSKLNTGATPNGLLLYLTKLTNKASKQAEAVNNFTTFKDMLFKKIMGFSKLSSAIHTKTTKLFEKIGRRAVVSAYEDTARCLNEASSVSKSASKKVSGINADEIIEINGVKLSKKEWLEKAAKLNDELLASYEENFGKNALQTRYYKMKNFVQKMLEKFENFRIFYSKDTITKFMSEAEIAKDRELINTSVTKARHSISYNLTNFSNDTNEIILEITDLIGFKDTKHVKKLGEIRGNLRKYINSYAQDFALKTKITDDINSLIQELQSNTNNQQIIDKLNILKKEFTQYDEGKIQKILNIYERLLPPEEFERVSNAYNTSIKSLNKSIKTETEDFLNKLRDLTLGSAPTDILTMLGSVSVLGYHLTKSKDSNQRQSIALKYGIPAIAGIGVSLYCNAKLYAGSKSLLVAAISGWILNRIGEFSDNKLRKFKENK